MTAIDLIARLTITLWRFVTKILAENLGLAPTIAQHLDSTSKHCMALSAGTGFENY